MLVDCTDVAAIDALFYLLSSTVELFDTGSSDSISGDDPSSFEAVASGGLGHLLGVLDCAANLPMHPLVVNGVARYGSPIDSLSRACPTKRSFWIGILAH